MRLLASARPAVVRDDSCRLGGICHVDTARLFEREERDVVGAERFASSSGRSHEKYELSSLNDFANKDASRSNRSLLSN